MKQINPQSCSMTQLTFPEVNCVQVIRIPDILVWPADEGMTTDWVPWWYNMRHAISTDESIAHGITVSHGAIIYALKAIFSCHTMFYERVFWRIALRQCKTEQNSIKSQQKPYEDPARQRPQLVIWIGKEDEKTQQNPDSYYNNTK